jgi:hypothetical protein
MNIILTSYLLLTQLLTQYRKQPLTQTQHLTQPPTKNALNILEQMEFLVDLGFDKNLN